ncbi:golvesin C-terminal-like domain-containing protein [Streptomyces siamensis]|uniref:Golvesin/Xly CBD-like domain-containing protein n=1 Tax=Streptomyces siamensis TaxID=1274986 RepID=A0ABP9JR96_9ACTN
MRFHRRTRAPLAAVAAGAVLAGLTQAVAWAAPPAPAAPATKTTAEKRRDAVPSAERAAVLGKAWKNSGDLAWTTSGDAEGFHILTARKKDGYTWRSTASLSEPGFDADAWIGNICVTGSGKRAVVVYAPRTFTNKPQLMARGGFTAVVDLASGRVTKLKLKASLSYYNPGCGPGESVILTQSGGEDLPGTRLFRLDASTGRVGKPIALRGQVTSAVPAAHDSVLAASGAEVVKIDARGTRKALVRTDGVPYRLTPDGDGGLAFLDKRGATSQVKRITAGAVAHPDPRGTRAAVLAEGLATETGLTRSAGTVYMTGTTRPTADRLPSTVRRLASVPKDATVSSRGEAVLTHTAWADGKGTLLLPGETAKARTVKMSLTTRATGRTASFTVDPARRVSAHAGQGRDASPGLLTGSGGSKRAALTATAAGDPSDPVESERTCSVPRNDPRNQAMQPKPRQVEWAVDQAVKGMLNTHISRAANWKNLGMPAYMPQALFLNPALDGGGRAMAQVMLGVTTQESNMWQAARSAVPGVTASPLIGNYYGINLYDGDTSNDWDVNFAKADCGYGITQITDHMRMAGREDGHGGAAWDYQKQRAAALDYTANISAGLQTLISKWNETRAAGMIANHGTTGRPENWYFALWAYNSGFHPNAGNGTPWGLGWANNPANPEWDAGRLPFMENAAGGEDASAAARPQNWPYQEKVLGFAAHPPSFLESPGVMVPAFRPSTWNGTSEAVTVKGSALYNRAHLKAPEDAFCNSSNSCDPGRISDGASNDTASSGPCGRSDFQCWWNKPVTWKSDCADTCGYEFIRFGDSMPEEADGTAYPPVCSTSGLPGNAIVVDDVPAGTPVVRPGCTNSWTNSGTFSFNFANNGVETVYPAKVDLHQLGAGFGGHFYFGHTRQDDAKGQRLKITGTWKLKDTLKGQAKVMVHLPDHGAQTNYARYEIDTAYGTETRTIKQPGDGNRWVSLGAYRFDNAAAVRLDTITPDGTGDQDIAFDAVAFVPGSYDLITDMRLPEWNPGAPEPPAVEPVTTLPGHVFPRPGVQSSRAGVAADEHPRAFDCRAVKGKKNSEVCLEFRGKPAGKTAQRQGTAAAAGTAFCSKSGADMFYTRTRACLQDSFSATLYENGTPIAQNIYAYKHEIDLDLDSPTIQQTVSVQPTTVDPKVPPVTVNVQSFCQHNCSSAGITWSGLPEWSGLDKHEAVGRVDHTWSGTAGNETVHLNWILSSTMGGAPNGGADYQPPSGKLGIRCDREAKGKSTVGCVFPDYIPTYVVNTEANPSAAAFYWILMQKLPYHPGSRDHSSPLNYLADTARQKANRKVICPTSGPDKFVGHPDSKPPNSTSSCDEYPFAATYQSGGMPPQTVSTGKDCTQLYAKPLSTGWTLLEDPRYARVNTWNEICGRASIPGDENSGAANRIGLFFVPNNRMLDKDAFYVSVPGFEGCTDLSQICVVRTR